jgi:hypothetical protein
MIVYGKARPGSSHASHPSPGRFRTCPEYLCIMNQSEIDVARRAIQLLSTLLPDVQGRTGGPTPQHLPVNRFVQEYLANDSTADLACEEAWQFFQEIAQAGGLPSLRKAAFLRQLPIEMDAVFGVKKCHGIERAGSRVRGFRGVGIRLDLSAPATVDREADVL